MALTAEKFQELMGIMIEKQNKDIEEKLGNKLDDVKKELSGAIQVVHERQDKMETEQLSMKEQMVSLKEQMADIKKIAEVGTEQHQLQEPQQNTVPGSYSDALQSSSQPIAPVPNRVAFGENEREKALDLLDLGRRTVSLHPLQESDIDFESKRGAKDRSEAMLWAVQTFLRYEMNIKSHVLATFTIENIFPPAIESWDTIYVTFSSITEANTVFSYTRNMRKEVTVGIFVPTEWQARFRAINSIAYGLRYPPSGQTKYSTRIKWGNGDLILHKKPPGTRHWTVADIGTPLPPVDMCAVSTPHMSPAPGRQGRDKRQRPSGSGSDSDSSLSQSRRVRARPDSITDTAVQQVPGPHAQVPVQDRGRVVNEESYCPSSPAPVKKHPGLSDDKLESPIFKKSTPSTIRINPLVI